MHVVHVVEGDVVHACMFSKTNTYIFGVIPPPPLPPPGRHRALARHRHIVGSYNVGGGVFS